MTEDVDLVVAIEGYRTAADAHDAAVAELVTQCGWDDAQQAAWLREGQRLIAEARQAIDRALASLDETTTPAPEPLPQRTAQPSGQSGYFPRWRV